MAKAKEVRKERTYNKEAFVDAAENSKDGLVLQVILEDGESYSKDDVEKLVEKWNSKKVESKKEKEVK